MVFNKRRCLYTKKAFTHSTCVRFIGQRPSILVFNDIGRIPWWRVVIHNQCNHCRCQQARQAHMCASEVTLDIHSDLHYYCGNHSRHGWQYLVCSRAISYHHLSQRSQIPLASVSVTASIDAALFPAIGIDLAVSDESGGASFDASLVEVTITHPQLDSLSGNGQRYLLMRLATLPLRPLLQAPVAIALSIFVTLIEATTDIAAEVTATSSTLSISLPSQ